MRKIRRVEALAAAAALWLGSGVAQAQSAGGDPAVGASPPGGPTVVQDAPADPPSAAPGGGGGAGAGPPAAMGSAPFIAPAINPPPASSGAQRPRPSGDPSGYSYGFKDSAEPSILAHGQGSGGGRAHRRKVAGGAVATYPGFRMRDDGGSRVFVQLTKAVPVEEHRAAGQVTYLLKGAHVDERNNENALVTVHFNTPVSRAKLKPVGRDLALTIELRGDAAPTYKMEDASGGSRLVVDFPEGHYLDGDGEPMRSARAHGDVSEVTGTREWDAVGDKGEAPRRPRRGARRARGAPPPPTTTGTSDTNP